MATTENDKKLANLAATWLKNITAERQQEEDEERSPEAESQMKKCTYFLGVLQLILIILFGVCGGKTVIDPDSAAGTGTQAYNMFIGVEIMM